MSKNKLTFTVELDGEVLDLCVVKPTAAVTQESQRVWNKAFNDAIRSDGLLEEKRQQLIKEQGIWGPDKEVKLEELEKVIAEKEILLKKGGVTKAKGRQMAIELRKLRNELLDFKESRNYLSYATVERISDNQRFNYFIYACTKWNGGDNAGQNYFDSFQEYEESESPVAGEAGIKLMELIYEFDEDAPLKRVENQFLIKYGFADSKGRLVDSEGRLCDENYRLLDDKGNYVNGEGHKVDKFGNPIDNFNIDEVEFKD